MQWCRAFVAVLDPQSEPATELSRERRKYKKEVKRNLKLEEEKAQKWKELREKVAQEEHYRQVAREEEISNMTPLERINDSGSLDDDTIRTLEKRQARLQRRRQSAIARLNKSAYRRRLEGASGGKIESMQPLQNKPIDLKPRERVELPPPGQFFQKVSDTTNRNKEEKISRSNRTDRIHASRFHASLSSTTQADRSRTHSNEQIPLPPPNSHDVSDTKQPFEEFFSEDQSLNISVTGSIRPRRVSSFIPPPPPLPTDDESRSSRILYDNHIDELDVPAGEDWKSIRSENSYSNRVNRALEGEDGFSTKQRAQRRIQSVIPTVVNSERLKTSDLNFSETAGSDTHSVVREKPTRRRGLFDDSSDESGENSDDGHEAASFYDATHPNAIRVIHSPSPPDSKTRSRHDMSNKRSSSPLFLDSKVSDTIEKMAITRELPLSASSAHKDSLEVSYVSSRLIQKAGQKPFGVFKYSLLSGSAEHTIEKSYKDLKYIHSRLMEECGTRNLPRFPSKHWYRDNLKAENMHKRALEILQYLQSLVSIPGIIDNEVFRTEYQIAYVEHNRDDKDPRQSEKDASIPGGVSAAKHLTNRLETQSQDSEVSKSKAISKSGRLFASSDSSNGESSDEAVKSKTKKGHKGSKLVIRNASTKSVGSSSMLHSIDHDKHTAKQSDIETEPLHKRDMQESNKVPKKASLPASNGMSIDLLEAIRRGKNLQRTQNSNIPSSNKTQLTTTSVSSVIPSSYMHGSTTDALDTSNPSKLTNVPSSQQVHSVSDAISNALAMRKVFVEFEERSDAIDSDDDWDD
ncbi:unnamed protein product [Albugo candida]|nr:unnamed protein product [Albugo candida]|eukprot:CCI45250.1 unnamed protein product [Albugo candida]